MKKFFSSLCACALALSTMSSVAFAAKDKAPDTTFTMNFEDTGLTFAKAYDTGTTNKTHYNKAKLYKAELSIDGPFGETTGDLEYAGIKGIQLSFNWASSKNLIVTSGSDVSANGTVTSSKTKANTLTYTLGLDDTKEALFIAKGGVVATWYIIAEDNGTIDDMTISVDPVDTQKIVYHIYDTNWDTFVETLTQEDITFVNYPAVVAPTLTGITLASTSAKVDGGEEVTLPAVTATYSDDSTAPVTATWTNAAGETITSFTAPEATTEVQTVVLTASYTEGDVTKTATYTVTVNAKKINYGATPGEEYYLSNDGTTKDVVVKSWNVVAANDGDGSIDLTFTSGDDEKVFALTHDVKGEAAIEFVALLLNAPADVTLTVPVE